MKILVFLYDVVNDKDIKLTDADVSNEWLTSKHDWSDTNPEVLLVRYVRAKTGGALSESSLSEAAAKVRPGQKSRGSKVPRTSDNANISATSFAFTTATTCRLFRRNRRGFCSSFLL